jgi:hypothetical protein
VEDVMAEVSLEVQEYFSTWDWLVVDSGDGFHLDTRELLDTQNELSGDIMIHPQHKLRTYDVADNLDMHDALDASHHQHLDDIMDERHTRRNKRYTETEEARSIRRRLKLITTPWSLKYNYIFLFLCNFCMLVVYYLSDFLDGVPRSVWFIIVFVHLSAIGLFAMDTVTHMLHERGYCLPKQDHNV